MAIQQKMHYSRSEDAIYGLDTCSNSTTISEQPSIANKMLCYVIHGLITEYTIPAAYFFHGTLSTENFYALTMKVLKLLTDYGIIVLRLVTDNASSNVALFKKIGKGSLTNYITHPFLQYIPFFYEF